MIYMDNCRYYKKGFIKIDCDLLETDTCDNCTFYCTEEEYKKRRKQVINKLVSEGKINKYKQMYGEIVSGTNIRVLK